MQYIEYSYRLIVLHFLGKIEPPTCFEFVDRIVYDDIKSSW